MYIKISTVIVVLIDLVFLITCLGSTRFGMEAMGVVFMLMGLGALHVLIGGPLLTHALLKKKWLEKQSDPVHAGLCRALTVPIDRSKPADTLAKKPDFSTPCVLPDGRKALPLFVLPETREDLLKKNIKPPAGMQEAIHSATAMILRHGADPNIRDDRGDSLLHNMTAPQNNTHQQESIEIVEILPEY